MTMPFVDVHPRPIVGGDPATALTRRCNGNGQPDGCPDLSAAARRRAVSGAWPMHWDMSTMICRFAESTR
jgi:hypothetical protein